MCEKKESLSKKKCCLTLLAVLIFSGCTSYNKKTDIISIQQKRIVKLETQLKNKQKQIDHLKVNKWIGSSTKELKISPFLSLKTMMKQKRWIEALKASAELKRQYPKSITLAKYRTLIFKRMGLENQALSEQNRIQKLKAQATSRATSKIK